MQLASSLQHDESERGIYHLAHALIKAGHRSIIVSSAADDNELVVRLKRDGSIHHQLPMIKKSWWALRQVFALRKLIKKYQPDVIHVHSRTPAWVLHWALRPLLNHERPKIVATMYGFYPLNNYAKALFDADLLICASQSIYRYLIDELSDDTLDNQHLTHIRCVRRGVDVRTYPYRHHVSVHWLQHVFTEFPQLEHKKWLIFPTAIGPEYGQEWLIDILGNLAEKYPDLHIIIMDDDTQDAPQPVNNSLSYDDFRQRTQTLGLANQISYVGRHPPDLREWLCSAHIVLALANHPESIGIHALKAIHLGTPVVGWDKGAFGDILADLYPRGLIKEQSAKALVRAINSQLECGIRPAITHDYEVSTMVNETLAVYWEAINQPHHNYPKPTT